MEFGNFDGVLIRKWCDLNKIKKVIYARMKEHLKYYHKLKKIKNTNCIL